MLNSDTFPYSPAARYYQSTHSFWLSVDPLADKYPNLSPYTYCAGNPVRLVDEDGRTPIGAVVEGIGAFVISAGTDFLSAWLIEGKDYAEAFSQIAWGTAAIDVVSTAAISFFIDGTGTAKTMAKIENSKLGKLSIEIVANMTSNICSAMETGESFSNINIGEEFLFASFSVLGNYGLGKRAGELLESVKNSNKLLYNRCLKQQRNMAAHKDGARLRRDANQVDIAKDNADSYSMQYAAEKIKSNAMIESSIKTIREVKKRENEY